MENSIFILKARTNADFLKHSLLLFSNKEPKNDLIKFNIGTIFRINDKKYVLTCNHCTKNSYDQVLIMHNAVYKCSTMCVAPELELALLTINDDNEANKLEYNTIDDFDFSLNKFRDNHTFNIDSVDIDEYIKTKRCNRIKLTGFFHDIIQESHNTISLNVPPIPYIRMTLGNKYTDISQLSGLSGSIVRNGTKIIGIISSVIESYLHVIPVYSIARFLNEFKETSGHRGICTLVGQYNSCRFEPDELKSKLIYGIHVTNTYGIKNNLIKGDVILQINGQPTNIDRKIYDPIIGISIDFNVFVAMNFLADRLIPLKVARLKKGSVTEYKEKDILVKAKPLDLMKYIPIEFNKKVYEFAHMKFIELSEDIINHYLNLGIMTGLSVGEEYIDCPYRNTESFVVILIDIDKSTLPTKLRKIVNNIG